MQLNLDCIKDVLLYLIDNIEYEECGDTWKVKPISLNTLYQTIALDDYSKTDIMRSTLQLIRCGYITCMYYSPQDKPYLDECMVDDVTFKGYQFAEAVREPTIWDKVKSTISECGNHTFKFIQSAALEIAINKLNSLFN